MLFAIFTISGHSMLPFLKPRDKIIVSTLPYLFSQPKITDIVVFKKDGKAIIKRIAKIEDEKIKVAGDNKNDSSYNVQIRKKEIIGKMIFKIS